MTRVLRYGFVCNLSSVEISDVVMRESIAGDAVQLVVLSGPSGSGKSTIVKELIAKSSVKLTLSVSATTRSKREGEVDGRDYYFLSQDEFRARREAGEFIECAEVHSTGNWYGTLKSELDRARSLGAWCLLEIDVQGARSILDQFPNAISIFLTTSDFEKRLRDRGTETEDVIQKRLATAQNELRHAHMYDYTVLNDVLSVAVAEIVQILERARDRVELEREAAATS